MVPGGRLPPPSDEAQKGIVMRVGWLIGAPARLTGHTLNIIAQLGPGCKTNFRIPGRFLPVFFQRDSHSVQSIAFPEHQVVLQQPVLVPPALLLRGQAVGHRSVPEDGFAAGSAAVSIAELPV